MAEHVVDKEMQCAGAVVPGEVQRKGDGHEKAQEG